MSSTTDAYARDTGRMDYTVEDLITIARALSDVERGFKRSSRRNKDIDLRIDTVPVHLRGRLVGNARRVGDKFVFQPIAAISVSEVETSVLPIQEIEPAEVAEEA